MPERSPNQSTAPLALSQLIANGIIGQEQARRLAAHATEDRWSSPYLSSVREHTRAVIDRLIDNEQETS